MAHQDWSGHDAVDAGTRAIETDGELAPLDDEIERVRARSHRAQRDLLERGAGERRKCVRNLARTLGQLLAARQASIRLERRLLAGRAVEGAQPARLEAELEQLLERLRALALHGAVLDRGDQIGQPAAPVGVL